MHDDWKIEYWEAENVNSHTWMAYNLFHNFQFPRCLQLAEVAFRAELGFWAEVPPVRLVVHRFPSVSRMSADPLLCHFGREGSRQSDFYKPLLGVFLSQPSPFNAQETQPLASSVLGLQSEVYGYVVAFPPLQCAETLLWPYWPYSRQGACRTVLAVPKLLALP